MGIESGDANVLKNMNKKAKIEHYMRGLKLPNNAGILSFASLIVGFPGETEDSVHRTIELINEINPNNAMERTKCDVESVRIIKKIVVSKPKK